ncbi:hypothetical protein AUTU_12330 [Aureibacter tunicatorum]|nr:hypothetical protein AUTU_12330 [Aureibacter tunicatorum]
MNNPATPKNTAQEFPYSGQGMDMKDHIIADKQRQLDEQKSDFKERQHKLENELEKLKEKYEKEREKSNELTVQLAYKDKEHSLSLKETEREHKKGLAGIAETIASNDKLANALTGLISSMTGAQLAEDGSDEDEQYFPTMFRKWFDSVDEQAQEKVEELISHVSHFEGNEAKVIQSLINNVIKIKSNVTKKQKAAPTGE